MSSSYFDRKHLAAFSSIGRGQPQLADQFFRYYGSVFQDGALSVREKALTALAVAHAVQCPYCIDAYTTGSLEAGADLEQMTEAVHVAAAVRSQSVLSLAVQMAGQAGQASMTESGATVSSTYYDRAHRHEAPVVGQAAPQLQQAFGTYAEQVFADGALEPRTKHLVALACAHAGQCPYQIEAHTQSLQDLDVSLEEMTEAVHVANAIRGGAALVHGLQMLDQVDTKAM